MRQNVFRKPLKLSFDLVPIVNDLLYNNNIPKII